MPTSSRYRSAPRFFDLGDEYADAVPPATFPQHRVRYRNDDAATTVGLDGLTDAEWTEAFARFAPLPGQPGPVAMR